MSVPHGKWHIDTEAVHAGEAERYAGAAITPIFQSATYVFDGDTSRGYDEVKYARCNNTPNHDVSPHQTKIFYACVDILHAKAHATGSSALCSNHEALLDKQSMLCRY